MPSLFRFLFFVGSIGGVIAGALYILAVRYEPDQREEVKIVQPLKVRKQ